MNKKYYLLYFFKKKKKPLLQILYTMPGQRKNYSQQVSTECKEMGEEEGKKEMRVCVTAANGYIGSFLLKNLLHRGYIVHATLRDPDNPAKSAHLLSLPGAKERLHLFKADLFQHGSFDSAIQGCDFVINLATAQDTQPDWVQPTIEGTLGILRACKKAKTVRRIIHASSLLAAYPLNEKGELKELLDESCWSPLDYIRSTNSTFGMYCVSKTLAEQAALRFGEEEQIEVVTVLVALVAGPSFTPTLPGSICYMLAPVTGDKVLYENLVSDLSLLGSMSLVHVEDVCNAHIFLMEHPSATGRFVCCSDAMTLSDVLDFFRKHHPEIPLVFGDREEDRLKKVVPISSKKLTDLGFSFKHGMEETLRESFECAKQMKVL